MWRARWVTVSGLVVIAGCGGEPGAGADATPDAPDWADAQAEVADVEDPADLDADAASPDASEDTPDVLPDARDTGPAPDGSDTFDASETTSDADLGPDLGGEDGVVTMVRAPAPGEVVFSELLIDPLGLADTEGEWLELEGLPPAGGEHVIYDLGACGLEDDRGRTFAFASLGRPLRVPAGGVAALARSAAALPPDLAAATYDQVLLGNARGAVRLVCGDELVDEVAWQANPWRVAPGRSLARTPGGRSDSAGAFCPGRAPLAPEPSPWAATRGSPGRPNPPCEPEALTACALLDPPAEVLAGVGFTLTAALATAGPPLDPATTPWLVVELGVADEVGAPSWVRATPAGAEGEAAWFSAPLPARPTGVSVASLRASLDWGATFAGCDARALDVVPSPCEPSPCPGEVTTRCEGEVAVEEALDTCAVEATPDGLEARCLASAVRTDCAVLGGRCEAGACVDVATFPGVGELVVTEILSRPTAVDDAVGEWVELTNVTAKALRLEGCVLTDHGGDAWTVRGLERPVLVPAGARVVLGASADRGKNGGVAVAAAWGASYLLEDGPDEVVLTCADLVVDAVAYGTGFPSSHGRAMQLNPRWGTAAANDAGASWCEARDAWLGAGDRGSPGRENHACADVVDRCRLVAPPSLTTLPGQALEVAVELREAGLTTFSDATDPSPLVRVQAGHGARGANPVSQSFVLSDAAPDPAWRSALDDRYLAAVTTPTTPGEYDVAARVTVDGGLTWAACDRSTGIVGQDGSENGYQPQNTVQLTVRDPDPCLPNPCDTPPLAACEGGALVTSEPLGACTVDEAGEARCTYATRRFGCEALLGSCRPCPDCEATCTGAAGPPIAGELAFTGLMIAPAAAADFLGEWVELTHVGPAPVNLAGCTLGDGSGAFEVIAPDDAWLVEPGDVVVFGRRLDPALNGGAPVDLAWGDAFGLGNAADALELRCGGALVDAVSWDGAWPGASGVALELDADVVGMGLGAADANDAPDAWCEALTPYGAGDLGTPGAPNAPCP